MSSQEDGGNGSFVPMTTNQESYIESLAFELQTKPLSSLCDLDDQLLREVARAVAACKMRKLGSSNAANDRDGMEGRREEFEFTTPKKWGEGKVRGVTPMNPATSAANVGAEPHIGDLERGVKGMEVGGEPAIKLDDVVKGIGGFNIGKKEDGGRRKSKAKKAQGIKKDVAGGNKEAGKGVFFFGASPEKKDPDSVMPPPPPPSSIPVAPSVGGVGLGLGLFNVPNVSSGQPQATVSPQTAAPYPSVPAANQAAAQPTTQQELPSPTVMSSDFGAEDDMEVTVEDMNEVMTQGLNNAASTSSTAQQQQQQQQQQQNKFGNGNHPQHLQQQQNMYFQHQQQQMRMHGHPPLHPGVNHIEEQQHPVPPFKRGPGGSLGGNIFETGGGVGPPPIPQAPPTWAAQVMGGQRG
uniref:Uncharacterized protein n=1 Tax=Triparma pacifica TaxID=91992 RepID=A0A7S2QUM6_9STRA|mmetsp:Transcript_1101/g.2023  ORF Transcript_1101/g.2023 Transcript_1101/m.2023 type:complete len:408 (+) Transcript_1101:42-1265(+)